MKRSVADIADLQRFVECCDGGVCDFALAEGGAGSCGGKAVAESTEEDLASLGAPPVQEWLSVRTGGQGERGEVVREIEES